MQISEAWPAIPDRSRSLFDQPAISARLDSNRKSARPGSKASIRSVSRGGGSQRSNRETGWREPCKNTLAIADRIIG
jgi:hypothetical protein